MTDKIKQITDKLVENQKSLHINRLPINTKRLFRKIAETEFEGDYGMLLKYLLDREVIHERIDLIEHRIFNIESNNTTTKEDEKKPIKMCDGRTIKE